MTSRSLTGFVRFVVPLAALMSFWPLAGSAVAQQATLQLSLDSTLIEKGQAIAGQVTINSSVAGEYDLTVDWIDNYGRVADRLQTRINLEPGTTQVPFSFDSSYALTMANQVMVRGRFVEGLPSPAVSQSFQIIPEPFDYGDYWCCVWGNGSTSNPNYFNALAEAHVNMGHIYRANNYFGWRFNVRPNNDFIENKVWFEMVYTNPTHDDNYNNYKQYLFSNSYGTPQARQYLIRPTSLNDPASLQSLVDTIRPRMQASRKWRPVQWNIADEYGLARRANPFDYDLGPAAINQFVDWLQMKYGDISALNEIWGTHFTSFDDLRDPINAPPHGEAALIVTQEIRDREFPLNSGSGLYSAKNFAPWSDFRTFMDITFANAMRLCVQTGRNIDPAIRVGFEGAEPATPMTGYDYWRQTREVGSIEAYDIANSPEYIRSFRDNRYGERIMQFITLFDRGSPRLNRYTLWFRLIHYGVTGAPIWWYKNFFTDTSTYNLTNYALGVAPTFEEFQNGIVKLLSLGEWDDSEVALLYSQKTIQINWMLDSEVDGKTWINRSNSWETDHNSMYYVHVGWQKALEDIGIKSRFMSYEELVNGELQHRGVKVLILPRVMALSQEERAAIMSFAAAGGTVIADNMCGYYDGYLRRRSIADGGGWFDSFFGITRIDYHTVNRNASVSVAWSGTPFIQTPPEGFEVLTEGLTTYGFYPVERGVRAAGGTPLLLWPDANGDPDPNKPGLIVRQYGAGKVVYMNLSLYRYGVSGDNFASERRNPRSPSATNIRRLVRNLMALGGVVPKVAIKQGHDNPDGTDVYNLEKTLRVDGNIRYLTCVVNSFMDRSSDDWSRRDDAPAVLFGQPGKEVADITIVLNEPAHVYDVRNGQYLGYGTSVNAQMPVYEGAVFALLPYRVESLQIEQLQFDSLHHATVTVRVVPDSGSAGRHLLRLEVFDPNGDPMLHLKRKVVAPGGVWTGVIPFALNEDLVGAKIRFTDVATGVSVEHTITAGDLAGNAPQVTAVEPALNSVIADPQGLQQVRITFSEDVTITQADVEVIGAVNGAANFTLAYDSQTATATLTFPQPLPDDTWQVIVHDSVYDADGNALDGEVDAADPQLPSGDGSAGGDFAAYIYKLSGDITGDGAVGLDDLLAVVNDFGQVGESLPGDVNQDGVVDLADLLIVASNFGSTLP